MAEAHERNEKSSLKEWLDSHEMQDIRRMFRESELQQSAEDQAWWDSLTIDERAQAFRQVIKLMYHAEVAKRGSYRYAMYDVFNIDYGDGMPHYMELHNLIFKGLEGN